MNLLNLTDRPKQNLSFPLNDGTNLFINLEYKANEKGWFYTATWTIWQASLRRLVVAPNMLRQFRRILPFGIASATTDGYEPIFQKDFINGRCALYLLQGEEMNFAEELIYNAEV